MVRGVVKRAKERGGKGDGRRESQAQCLERYLGGRKGAHSSRESGGGKVKPGGRGKGAEGGVAGFGKRGG